MQPPESEDQRRRAITAAVALTANTPQAPQRYERQLLSRYQRGEINIEQVISLLDNSIYQVLYHSQATGTVSEAQLQSLLAEARGFNTRHQLTGILLYSDGRFVQLLEGPEPAVRALYAKIQQDPRHTQVVTVSEGPGPSRRFADWSMGLGRTAGPAAAQALDALLVQENLPAPELAEPYLHALLRAFGVPFEEPAR
ncbi:BLUF domain-containing protein [Hymenobacter sp. H14-R3]|uniref:BLUF domain-containing protein n=1 Tax=Hymenobacter sp. H14-R3 TaxID=3046308 RepID=UPI0024BA67E7|nr:BLUF domain-containing protein [Hymenobacter sp. H14-R3]MDJ0364481.1 BLUF domain-containing protein [Hymenobacter sp. H14-R3]